MALLSARRLLSIHDTAPCIFAESRYRRKLQKEQLMNSYALTVDAVVFKNSDPKKKTEVLLIRRKNIPYAGCWALPRVCP